MKLKRSHKNSLKLHGLLLLGAGLLSLSATAQESAALQDDTDRLSYALGMDLGQQLHRLAVAVKPELFAKGLQDGISGDKTLMSHEEVQASITALQDELKRREKAKAMLRESPTGQVSQSPQPAQR